MRSSEAIRYCRHVAALGLSPHVAIAEIMRSLNHAVPAAHYTMFWSDRSGRPVDLYAETIIPSALESSFALANGVASPDEPSLDKILSGPRDFDNCALIKQLPGWDRSAMKNDLFRGYGVGSTQELILRDEGILIGGLGVSREPGAPPVNRKEQAILMNLRSHLIHALRGGPEGWARSDDTLEGEPVCLIAARSGEILFYGPGAEEMMFKVTDSMRDASLSVNDRLARLTPTLTAIVQALFLMIDGVPTDPASKTITSRWGRFQISAHPLTSAQGLSSDQVIVTIQPRLDRRLKAIRVLHAYQLTLSEKRVALAMLGKDDGAKVANSLGLSLGSYRQYAKRVYAALGVEGRQAVMNRLLS